MLSPDEVRTKLVQIKREAQTGRILDEVGTPYRIRTGVTAVRGQSTTRKSSDHCPIKTAICRLETSYYENATEICGSLRNRKRELEANLLLAVVNIAKILKRTSDIGFVFEYAID
jgi:hypothetical protein